MSRRPFLIVTCLLICLFSATNNAMGQHTVYKGKIKLRGSFNVDTVILIEVDMYVWDQYILEELLQVDIRSHSILRIGEIQEIADSASVKTVLQKYILIDLAGKKSMEFDTASNPAVLDSYPLEQKKDGFRFEDELPDLKGQTEKFSFSNDTILHGNKYAIIRNVQQVVGESAPAEMIRIYVDKTLKGFPVHLISTALDQKFGGACTRMESTDSTNNTFIVNWKYTPGLTAKESALINKFISIYQGKK